jgi:hypothetical protein
METITWKYGKALANDEAIRQVEKKLGIAFPETYIQCVMSHNGGRPTPYQFDIADRSGAVFQHLLRIEPEEKNGVLSTLDGIGKRLPPGLAPFAGDPFGNYLCFRYPAADDVAVAFWDHENGSASHVCAGFAQLLRMLY